MSTPFHNFCLIALLMATLQISAEPAHSHDGSEPFFGVGVRVDFVDGKPRAYVSGSFTKKRRAEFQRSFSLPHMIGRRPLQVEFRSHEGKQLGFREIAEGEYVAEDEIRSWSYVIDLSPVNDRKAAAHASWISGEFGLLMMRDLWPRVDKAYDWAYLNLKIPEGWSLAADKLADGSLTPLPGLPPADGWFAGASSDSVFVIAKQLREREVGSGTGFRLILSGEWNFTDLEAADMVRQIKEEYERVLGGLVFGTVRVSLAKFPTPTSHGEWEAETRGNNVTIISSDMPFKKQSLQRLHEQLRHELFHLWIPNGVNLTGNYDWFYEGFALYQSLKLAVALNRIRFDDFLDTLSRAHTIDSAPSQRVSLIQASTNRFGGSNTQVYARGMLVAFLTDLAMMQKGKRSVEDLLKDLYLKHRKPAEPTDGNAAVIEMLKHRANASIVEKYIIGTDKIEWANDLAAAGIEDSDPGLVTTLRVKEKLKGGQKAMLDKLGYNNWRKLSGSSK